MLEQTLEQLMHALSEEEAGALLDGFTVPQAVQERIAANVTLRMKAALPEHRHRTAISMHWIYSAAACAAVILAAAAFRYFGQVAPVEPTFPDGSGISQTDRTTTAMTAVTTTAPPDTQSTMTETVTGSIDITVSGVHTTEPVYTETSGSSSAEQSSAAAESASTHSTSGTTSADTQHTSSFSTAAAESTTHSTEQSAESSRTSTVYKTTTTPTVTSFKTTTTTTPTATTFKTTTTTASSSTSLKTTTTPPVTSTRFTATSTLPSDDSGWMDTTITAEETTITTATTEVSVPE